MSSYTVKVIGTTPLMQNNPASMLVKKGSTRAETNLAPHEQAENKVYKSGEDFVHPASSFYGAFISAGKKYKIGRASAASYLAGAMSLLPADFVVICDANGEPVTEYEIDVRGVVMPSTKGRVIRGRPKFTEWGCVLTLGLNDKYWPGDDELLEEILSYAGEMIGIGEGRPEKRALQFGKFRVDLSKN